jgi:hypothetical protein
MAPTWKAGWRSGPPAPPSNATSRQSGQQARGRSRSALPARRSQRVSGSCSFWNAPGQLEDHAVHVPAGAARRGLLRHRAIPPPGFGHVPHPLAVAEHDAAPATPTSTCPYRGRAGRCRRSRSRPSACSRSAGAAGNHGSRPPMHSGQREGRARHLADRPSPCGGSGWGGADGDPGNVGGSDKRPSR